MLHIAELLPPSKLQPLRNKLAVQWYYMTYHHANCAEYVKSDKKLAVKTIKMLTANFQLLFAQCKLDSTPSVLRLIDFGTMPSGCLRATYVTSARHIARAMHVARCASMDNMMTIVHIVVIPMINVAMTAGDQDAMDATDATTSQNVEAAVAEVTVQQDATVKNVKQCCKKSCGQNVMSVDMTTKRIGVMTAIDAATMIIIKKLKHITLITAT